VFYSLGQPVKILNVVCFAAAGYVVKSEIKKSLYSCFFVKNQTFRRRLWRWRDKAVAHSGQSRAQLLLGGVQGVAPASLGRLDR